MLVPVPASAQRPAKSDPLLEEIRRAMKHADFAPVVPDKKAGTEADYWKQWRAWVRRVLVVPMAARIAGKPRAAEAQAFAEEALDACYSNSRVNDAIRDLIPRAEKLVAAGEDDPVVLWLAAEVLARKDVRQARAVATAAREHFRKSACSRVLGMLMYVQKADRHPPALGGETGEFLLKGAGYLAESLKEPDTWTDADAAIYIRFLLNGLDGQFGRDHEAVCRPLFHPGKFPPWARGTLAGVWEVEHGWQPRGVDHSRLPVKTTPEELKRRLTAARKHLEPAWKLEPKQPYAATGMIAVAMADGAGDSCRRWFDRALAASFDYRPAWEAMNWALRPERGGSTAFMTAHALAAAECGAFSTDAPFFLGDALRMGCEGDSFDDIRAHFRQPSVAAAMKWCYEGYWRAARSEAERQYFAWWRVYGAVMGGRLEDCAAALADTGSRPMPEEVHLRLLPLRWDETRVRGCAALAAGREGAGRLDGWWEAENRYLEMDIPGCIKALDALKELPPAAATMAAQLRRLCEMETTLAAGEWITLKADPDFSEWFRFNGGWQGDALGNVKLQGDEGYALLVHKVRIGPDFEMRGTISATEAGSGVFDVGLVFDYGFNAMNLGHWLSLNLDCNKGALFGEIHKGCFGTTVPINRNLKADLKAPIPWSAKVENHVLNFVLGDSPVFLGLRLDGNKDLDGWYTPRPYSRIGLWSVYSPPDQPLLFSPIQVRRLRTAAR